MLNRRIRNLSLGLSLALMAPAVALGATPGAPAAPAKVSGTPTTTASGLKYYVLAPGKGAVAKSGDQVKVHYTGWLTDGKKFDSSLDRGEPIDFKLGAGQVIKGWDEGVAGMKVGGRRQITIPPHLGYGKAGAGGVIKGGETLVFVVDLLGVG